jgi:hypothetical protein
MKKKYVNWKGNCVVLEDEELVNYPFPAKLKFVEIVEENIKVKENGKNMVSERKYNKN